MYQTFEYVLVAAIGLLGIYMAVCPKRSLKVEDRENEKKLANVRKRGILITVMAIVCAVILVIQSSYYA